MIFFFAIFVEPYFEPFMSLRGKWLCFATLRITESFRHTALSAVTLPFTIESVSDSLKWLPDALTIRNHVIVSGPPFWACHVWLVVVGIMNNFMSLRFYEVEVKQVGWILRNVKNKARLITHSRLSLSSPTSLHRPWRELFMTVFYPIKLF